MTIDVSRLKEITVLYCEDEEYLRDITKGILESFTKEQFIAVDGEQGLEMFKNNQEKIDLIITDVNMPNMSGLEMSKEIKKINQNIPIIVATAFSNSEYLLEAIDLGIDKYVLKPVNVKKLLDIMTKSLLYHELQDLYRDQLTKLPNRNAMIKDLKQRENSLIALVDIDKFSVLNDLYGEDNGDKILIKFVEKLNTFYPKDTFKIYRVGSDRFVILCLKDKEIDTKKLTELSTEFIKDIDALGIDIDNSNIVMNVTAGIAQSNDQHAFEYAQRVIQKARKKYLKVLEYNSSLFEQKEDFENNLKWIKKLKNGVNSGSFQPYFQPIIDAKTKVIYKYEALIRYIDTDGEEIAPFVFLPIAKRAKLFPIIIKIMLLSVLKTIKEKNVRVAINLSFDDIINKETHKFIFETLEDNKEQAKLLDFEILESEEIEDYEVVKVFINKIKEYGCGIGVDDFGAGYANFSMLEALDIDFVKIDGSLIKQIDKANKQALIVEAISQFCKKLDIKTVAEFVSSEEIYLKTKDLEIDYMQGYHFGKPSPSQSI
ncbi:MAG: EAL domain-containing protein [Campylobacterota bacterium]|nr:EAL domain-containing protein [Campylobacterota bacterium]